VEAHLPEDDLEVIEVLIRTGVWRVGSGRYALLKVVHDGLAATQRVVRR
jgi:hypothetical protein